MCNNCKILLLKRTKKVSSGRVIEYIENAEIVKTKQTEVKVQKNVYFDFYCLSSQTMRIFSESIEMNEYSCTIACAVWIISSLKEPTDIFR